jgi:tRNA (mo5U34)-methyltransferase
MLKRGAREVVAIDVLDPRKWDWPVGSAYDVQQAMAARKRQGEGFEIVMRALGKSVERRELSVYDLDPDSIGTFDFVYVGSLLLHLRDPVRALEKVRGVCAGRMALVDAIDPVLTRLHPRRPVANFDGFGRPWWWKPNVAALERIVESAGFELLERPKRLNLPHGPGRKRRDIKLQALRSHEGRVELRHLLLGDPHAAFLAEPRPGLEAAKSQ